MHHSDVALFQTRARKNKGSQTPKSQGRLVQQAVLYSTTKQYLTLTNAECPPMQWSHAMDPPGRSHSLETRYDKEGMLSLHSPLSKGPRSTPKQYHAPAPMLGALLCNRSHAMDPPRRSHSFETRLDKGGMLSFHCQQFIR